MSKIRSIQSFRELHNLLENHTNKNQVIVYFDIDLTLTYEDENENELFIEPKATKELFDYILKNNILFSFITARFHDTACNARKRDLNAIKKDIDESIFPTLEFLGIDLTLHKSKELENKFLVVRNRSGKCVGLLYRGIFFSSKKGETIKYYQEEYGLDKTHPHVIFVDDLDQYLKSAIRHVPNVTVLRREFKNDEEND